ncbi:MAG: macro domain-containing protein [Pseudomonadota bacterium]
MRPGVSVNTAQVKVKNQNILEFEGDAILVPTISEGLMVYGIAASVKEITGQEVEDQVLKHAPLAVGAALVTEAKSMHVRFLVHSPIIEALGLRFGIENIRRCTRAALLATNHHQIAQLAIPGFCWEECDVPVDEIARAILDEIRGFRGPHPTELFLVDENPDMLEAFRDLVHSR